jgi:hypothetical protein
MIAMMTQQPGCTLQGLEGQALSYLGTLARPAAPPPRAAHQNFIGMSPDQHRGANKLSAESIAAPKHLGAWPSSPAARP